MHVGGGFIHRDGAECRPLHGDAGRLVGGLAGVMRHRCPGALRGYAAGEPLRRRACGAFSGPASRLTRTRMGINPRGARNAL